MKKGLIFTALMCTLTMGLVACGNNASDTPQVPVATLSSIKLNLDNVEKTFKVGDTFSSAGLVVTAKYSDGSEKAVEAGKYSVSSPDMSTSGTKVVTVTYEGKTAQYNITVEPAEIVVSITNKEDFEPEWRVGDSSRTLKLSVTGVVVDAAIRSGDLVISASNPEVVGIDGREISAKAAGTTTISATYKGDKSDSVEVTVLPKKLLSKVLNPVEEEEYLLARADGNNPNALMYVKNDMSNTYYLGFESDRTKAPVLTVKIDESAEDYKYELVFDAGTDNEHEIGALCTAKGKYATGFVGNKISGLDVPETFWKIDEKGQLWCKVQDDGADVELLLGGQGTYNTTSADLPNKIKNPAFIYTENAEEKPATEINVSPESLELVPGQNKRLTVSLLPVDTTDLVSYIPSNSDVVEISDDGVVTALTAGEADILVKANDDVSKTVHVVVSGEAIKFGTREAPLTVDEVLAEIVKCADEGDSSSYPFYVYGEISESKYSSDYKNATITLKGTSGNLEAYRAIGDENIDISALKATDQILVVGYSDIYNKKIQLAPLADVGTKEYGVPTVLSVTPGTPGEDIPEPALVTGKTIADFKADASGEFKQLYELTGTVTKWNKGSDAGDYGNFYIEDESGELLIYGSTATEGKLAWDATQGKYVLDNPKDFLKNEVTKDMKIGDTVTVHATLTSYQGNPQAQAQVISVTPGEVPELTGIKFDVEGESIELIEGRTKAIKLLPLPALAELPEEDPTWESSDPEVARISEGNNVGALITAVKEGTAKITAKYSDTIKAELTVNVIKDSGEQQEVSDVINSSFTGITSSSYTDFSGKTGKSGAVYAGQCAGSNTYVQLRSKNSNSGIISTTSGGKVAKVIIEWADNTEAGRTLNIYGSNTAYSAASDLYAEGTQGKLLGTIVKGTSTELEISGDYAFIGLRSDFGAMYITSITIVWVA